MSSSSSKPFPTKRKEKLRAQQQCLVKRASQSEHNDYRHCERPSLQSQNILTNYSNCAKKPSANPASLELSNYSNLIYTTAYVVSVNDSDENSKNLPSSTDYQALTSYCLTNCKESSKKGFLIGPRQQVSKSGASASRVGSLDPAINLTFSSDSQQSLRSHSFSVTFGKFQLFWFFCQRKTVSNLKSLNKLRKALQLQAILVQTDLAIRLSKKVTNYLYSGGFLKLGIPAMRFHGL